MSTYDNIFGGHYIIDIVIFYSNLRCHVGEEFSVCETSRFCQMFEEGTFVTWLAQKCNHGTITPRCESRWLSFITLHECLSVQLSSCLPPVQIDGYPVGML
jgi:hypothetical protein